MCKSAASSVDGLNIILSIKTFLLCCFYYSQQDVFNCVSFVFIVVYLILLSYFYLFVVFNFIFRCCDGYYSIIIKAFLISILPSLLFVSGVTDGFTWSTGCPRGPSDVSHLWLVAYLASARTVRSSLWYLGSTAAWLALLQSRFALEPFCGGLGAVEVDLVLLSLPGLEGDPCGPPVGLWHRSGCGFLGQLEARLLRTAGTRSSLWASLAALGLSWVFLVVSTGLGLMTLVPGIFTSLGCFCIRSRRLEGTLHHHHHHFLLPRVFKQHEH